MRLIAKHCLTGKTAAFRFEGERVSILPARLTKAEYLFGPAWTDLQCNGFAGVDFNHPDVSPVDVCRAVRAMWRTGCATVLPTIITSAPERIESLFRLLVKALEIDPAVRESVPGFHLEGPFISAVDGARGAHPARHCRIPDRRLWRRWQKAAGGLIRMVTLAPELPRAFPFISRIASEGVVVAIGHTMAGIREIQHAAEAGARLSTHLGNGCPQSLPRHENPILAQLGEDRLAATFIPDGIHLPAHVLRSFVRAKTPARSLIVTDAMAAAGALPGRYTLAGQVVEVGPDRIVRQPGQPNFAGSALVMNEAVVHYGKFTGESLAESWIAASTRPDSVIAHRSNATVIARFANGELTPVALIRKRRVLWAAESDGE